MRAHLQTKAKQRERKNNDFFPLHFFIARCITAPAADQLSFTAFTMMMKKTAPKYLHFDALGVNEREKKVNRKLPIIVVVARRTMRIETSFVGAVLLLCQPSS